MLNRRNLLKLAAPALLLPSRKLILPDAKAQWSSCGAGFCNNGGSLPVPTWSRVQGTINTGPSGSGTTYTVPFSAPIGSSNIGVGGLISLGQSLISVTDDKGNAWDVVNQDGTIVGAGFAIAGFRSHTPITNGAQTLTLVFTGTPGLIWVVIDEFSAGLTPAITNISLDGSQLAVSAGSTDTKSPFQTLYPNDLLYSAVFSTNSLTGGAGWTVAQGSGGQQMSMWKQAGAAGNSNVAAYTPSGGQTWASTFGTSIVANTSWVLRQNNIQRSATSVPNGGTASISFFRPMATGSVGIGAIALGISAPENDMSFLSNLVDDKGNTWLVLGPGVGTGNGRAVIWSGGVLNNNPTTITATVSHTESILFFLMNEFILPPGKTTANIDTFSYVLPGGGPPYPSDTITTTHNNELIYGFFDTGGSGSQPDSGACALNGISQTWCDAYLKQQSAGAISETWIANAGPLDGAIAGFSAS